MARSFACALLLAFGHDASAAPTILRDNYRAMNTTPSGAPTGKSLLSTINRCRVLDEPSGISEENPVPVVTMHPVDGTNREDADHLDKRQWTS